MSIKSNCFFNFPLDCITFPLLFPWLCGFAKVLPRHEVKVERTFTKLRKHILQWMVHHPLQMHFVRRIVQQEDNRNRCKCVENARVLLSVCNNQPLLRSRFDAEPFFFLLFFVSIQFSPGTLWSLPEFCVHRSMAQRCGWVCVCVCVCVRMC